MGGLGITAVAAALSVAAQMASLDALDLHLPVECTRIDTAEHRIAKCTRIIDSKSLLGIGTVAELRIRAEAFARSGKLHLAIDDFTAIARQMPDDGVVYFERATAYFRLGEHVHAIDDYGRGLELDPARKNGYLMLGISHYHVGNYEEALQNYTHTIDLDPLSPRAFNERAWVLYLQGRDEAALSDTETALSINPRSAHVLDTRAHILTSLGDPDAALAHFARAIEFGGRRFIRMYQKALAGHGYYLGNIDGEDSDAMRRALTKCVRSGCRLLN